MERARTCTATSSKTAPRAIDATGAPVPAKGVAESCPLPLVEKSQLFSEPAAERYESIRAEALMLAPPAPAAPAG